MEKLQFKSSTLKNVKFSFKTQTYKNMKCKYGKPTFSKKRIPFDEIIQNYNKKNSLHCKNNTYPKYIDGTYCCDKQKFSKQELLDYINMLLEKAEQNISFGVYYKYKPHVDYLIQYRNLLLNPKFKLVDNLGTDIIEKLMITEKESMPLKKEHIIAKIEIQKTKNRTKQEGKGKNKKTLNKIITKVNKNTKKYRK